MEGKIIKKIYLFIALVLTLFLRPVPVYADMLWPSLYIAEGLRTWWIIIIGLLIEFIFIKIFTKDGYKKSILMTITINAVSTLLGIIAIPLSGLLGEFILFDLFVDTHTFHISHWIFSYLLAVLCNTAIEGLALKVVFKKKFIRIFLWLFIANVFSVLICALKMSIEYWNIMDLE